MGNLEEMARLHSAGATVRNISPFSYLPSHRNDAALSIEFIHEWVVPYYMKIGSPYEEWQDEIRKNKSVITKDICLSLLGDFNWRMRLVGAYLAAVKNYADLVDIIGVHLLKSEVCCVGHIYGLTLAFFNNEKSSYYLKAYLDYYLLQPHLYFDQDHVMSAVKYLDDLNGYGNAEMYIEEWRSLRKIWGRNYDKIEYAYFTRQIPILKALNEH